ncbi:cytochrome P450 [Lentinus tigrinus ALCF2SS1-7]|uniref:cytochrome P450 n=1 Tax=Lentinus tigrinus ALCF2SS1-7 TaxID=1328758 RepID=UPI001165D0C9|nr:cytochrome P450 [Lentinus tigrinus ALCF2SS1-7]
MPLSLLAIAATAALLLGVIFKWLRRRSLTTVRGPPSPSLLLGHEHALSTQEEVGILEFEWLWEYGPTWKIGGNFGTDLLMTADPKALQHIFHKSGYNYTKRTSANYMGYMLSGPGIVVSLDKDHQRHRKIMNPAFNAAHLKTFLPLFQRISSKMVEQWKAELSGTEQMHIMVNKWLSRATLDIIGEAAFDYDYGALNGAKSSPLNKAYDNIFKDISFQPPAAFAIFNATWDYVPETLIKLVQFIPVNPFTRMLNLKNLFTEYGKQILREQRSEVDVEKPSNSRDVMSILIKANASADPKTRLTDAELMAEMYTLTLAGHETTSSTLTFLTYELARHPEYQARMRKEIQDRRALAAARGDADFTVEDLDSLSLTVNAIKETLRFHPIVPQLFRVAVKDDVIPLSHPVVSTTGETITEVPVQAGQVIVTSFAAYHRLKDVWGDDADVWNPDRFFRPETGKHTNVGVFSNLMSFSAGVRACIGWRFSLIEMQAILAETLENFEVALPEEKLEIKRAPMGPIMLPVVVGKEELGSVMPLRVSLVQQ